MLYKIADVVTPLNQRPRVHSYLSQYNCCPPPIFMILVTIAEVIYLIWITNRFDVWEGLAGMQFEASGNSRKSAVESLLRKETKTQLKSDRTGNKK